jgi:hypothetical protein
MMDSGLNSVRLIIAKPNIQIRKRQHSIMTNNPEGRTRTLAYILGIKFFSNRKFFVRNEEMFSV